MAGVAETGDRFGSVLQLVHRDGGWELAVGQPQEDVGSKVDAGSVTMLRFNVYTQRMTSSRLIVQGLAGAGGVAERGDRFGTALTALWDRIVVGAPGEDLGSMRDAGLVQIYAGAWSGGRLKLVRTITQNSAYVPDRVEAGDQFGASAGRLGGGAESGDRLGATLAPLPSGFVPDYEKPDEHIMDGVLVGVPGRTSAPPVTPAPWSRCTSGPTTR